MDLKAGQRKREKNEYNKSADPQRNCKGPMDGQNCKGKMFLNTSSKVRNVENCYKKREIGNLLRTHLYKR